MIVLLSDYEGTPLSLLEGMANGLVPIVMDIGGGVGDLVQHGYNGLVVKNREKDFEEKVQMLLNNRQLFAQLSINARSTIEQKYSIGRFTKQWVSMFEDLYKFDYRRKKIKNVVHVRIPSQYRFPGVHYFPWYVDLFAKIYATGRYLLNKTSYKSIILEYYYIQIIIY